MADGSSDARYVLELRIFDMRSTAYKGDKLIRTKIA